MSETDSTCQSQIMSLALANNHLAVNLHRLLAEERGNVFFSPFSISTAMAMLVCAAEGETESEMREALGYNVSGLKRDGIASAFEQQMSLLLKKPDSYTLSCANSILSQKKFEIKDGYKQILAKSFKALMFELDFLCENEKAINQINDWVKEQTNNMITELVQSLDPATAIVLLNAVYFKGSWMREFEKAETFLEDFYNKGMEDNMKQVDMMHMTESFPFYEDASLQALQLSYIGGEVAMIILLPHKINGLEAVEAGLTPHFIQDLRGKLCEKKVEVTLPKFRLEYEKSLIPCFQQLGVNRLFKRGAELGVASDSPDLTVSDVLHKAVLDVNEEGTEAAAVTVCQAISNPIFEDLFFVADHPFAFFIYNTSSGLILFMGRVDEL